MESNSSVAAPIDGSWGSQVTFKINTESPTVLDFFLQVLVFQEVADSKVLSILILIFFLNFGNISKTISNQGIYKHIIMSPKVKILKCIFPLFPNKWTAIIVLVNSNIKTQIHIPKTHFNITVTEESLACFEKWRGYVGFLFQRELVPRMPGFILYNIMQRKTLHSGERRKIW